MVQSPDLWNVYDPKLVRWRLASERRAEQYASLTELRIAVEPIAAAGAARRASAAERSQLVSLAADLRRLGEAGELEGFLEADIAYHRLLLKCCGTRCSRPSKEMAAEVLTSRTHSGTHAVQAAGRGPGRP